MASVVQVDETEGGSSRLALARDAERVLARFAVQPDRDCPSSLSMLIEREIIPRLVVAHAADRRVETPIEIDAAVTAADVELLATLALRLEADALLGHVEAMVARGVAIDTLLVDLLAPTARLLGLYWEEDRCDFLDVTMGLWRLQEAINELATRIPPRRSPVADARRALFASMPGDQHSFGAVVIDELFRRDGWLTDRMAEAETPDLLRRIADQAFDLVGLTISCDCHIGALPSLIAALRNVSDNPRLCVMVGGRVFSADPELATQVGADGTACDAKLALQVASSLVRERRREALVHH